MDLSAMSEPTMRGATASEAGRSGTRAVAAVVAASLFLAATALLPGTAPAAAVAPAADTQEAGPPPGAATEDPVPDTPEEVEARMVEIAKDLRCPVCRNESVLESTAPLAREMQQVIRERLEAGQSPEEIEAYFVSRYGEWVLLQPRPEGINLLVYVLPPLALLVGVILAWHVIRRWSGAHAAARAGDAGHSGGPPPGAEAEGGRPAEPSSRARDDGDAGEAQELEERVDAGGRSTDAAGLSPQEERRLREVLQEDGGRS